MYISTPSSCIETYDFACFHMDPNRAHIKIDQQKSLLKDGKIPGTRKFHPDAAEKVAKKNLG